VNTLLAPLLLSLAAAPVPAEPPTLTLDAALAELDRQGLTVIQARGRAEEVQGLALQALAPLLPTVGAGVTWLRNSDDAGAALGPRQLVIQPLHSATWTLSARAPLVVPSAWFDLAQARHAALAAARSEDAVQRAVRTGFAQSAHQAAANEEVVDASERAVENAAALVKSAERRVSAGTAAPLEVTRARAELLRRQSDVAGARADRDRARLALGILLGRAAPVRVSVPEVSTAGGAAAAAAAEVEATGALARRPEVAAQGEQVKAAQAAVRSAWARLAPQLSASAAAFTSDAPYPTGKKDGWRVTLDATWALYDGGLRSGKRRQAEAQVVQAEAAAEAQRLAVLQEVEDGRRDLSVAGERLVLALALAGLAADSAASAKRSFEAGVASSLDVIDANDRLYQADTGLALSRARLAQARLALARALGEGPARP